MITIAMDFPINFQILLFLCRLVNGSSSNDNDNALKHSIASGMSKWLPICTHYLPIFYIFIVLSIIVVFELFFVKKKKTS